MRKFLTLFLAFAFTLQTVVLAQSVSASSYFKGLNQKSFVSTHDIYKLFIRKKQFKQLGKIIAKNLGSTITLEELQSIATETKCSPLQQAIKGAIAIYRLQKMDEIPLGLWIQEALFIETKVNKERSKNKHLFPRKKTKLPFTIEYDQKSKYTFIHLLNNHTGFIGSGCHKIVLRSVIYKRGNSEVVARCIMQSPTLSNEVAYMKKFHRARGLLEVKAVILRKDWGKKRQHDIFLKLYNEGALYSFLRIDTSKYLSSQNRYHIAHDIMQGISRIHKAGFVHRDLHLGNYFIYRKPGASIDQLHAVVGDYGKMLSLKDCKGRMPQIPRNFQAPEALVFGKLKKIQYQPCDIYAMGCVFYWLEFSRRPPWFGTGSEIPHAGSMPTKQLIRRKRQIVHEIHKTQQLELHPIREKIEKHETLTASEKFKLLLFSMLHPAAKKRPSAQSVKNQLKELCTK